MTRQLKRWGAALLTAALGAALLAVPAFAAGSIDLPDLPADVCVVDEADMLSSTTEQYLDSLNGALQTQCQGATLAVLTVPQIGNTTTEEYAIAAMETWGVGDANEQNGALLLLVGETAQYADGDYYLAYSKGFSGTDLAKQASTILSSGEKDFAAGDYDTFVTDVADAAAQCIADQYGVTLGSTGTAGGGTVQPQPQPEPDPGPSVFSLLGRFLLVLAVFLILFSLLIAPMGRSMGWGWGPFAWTWGPFGWWRPRGPRPPRPPRPPRNPPRPPRGGGFGGMGGGGSFGGGFGRGGGFGGGGFRGGGFGGMGGGGSFGGGAGRGR